MSKQELKERLDPYVGTLGQNKIFNWNGYGVIVGHGKSTHILDEIQYRRKKVKQNMIIVVGPPGEGKSYFALRLGQIFDKKFNPFLQIVFERTHLLWLLGPNTPLRMGQVIIIDEAQFIAGARRWYEDIQKDVMEHIEAIRSKGFIVIIVALHINLLDKIVRKYVLSHMILLMERGKALVYHLWTPPFLDKLFRKRLGKMALQLPDYEKCAYPNCLICKYQNKCMTLRAVYERLKTNFLSKNALQSQQKAEAHERKRRFINYEDTLNKVLQHPDKIVYTRSGTVETESIRLILEEKYGIMLGDVETRRLVKRGLIKHPEIFKKEI